MSRLGQNRPGPSPETPMSFRAPPYHFDMHTHAQGQLVYIHRGKLTLLLPDAAWAMFGPSLFWVPAGWPHGGGAITSYTGSTFWESKLPNLQFPKLPCLVSLPPELNTVAVSVSSHSRVGRVFAKQLSEGRLLPFALALPRSPALHRFAIDLLADPLIVQDVGAAAHHAGMSRRSFTRQFHLETGRSFSSWRRTLLCCCADLLVRENEPVSAIATQLGYESVSAFIAMYRKTRGRTPGMRRMPAKETT
jgi:AraC-like DNA-binding protein